MFCFKCGSEIPEKSEFCMKCGTQILQNTSNNQNINHSPNIIIKSPLISTIIASGNNISYISTFKNENISINDITAISYIPGTTFENGKLFISTNYKEYFLDFGYKNNSKIEQLCRRFSFYIPQDSGISKSNINSTICPHCLCEVADGNFCPKCSKPLHPKWYQKNSPLTIIIMLLSFVFLAFCLIESGVI